MALTSRDETDLLLPLFRGVHENPPFSTFTEKLRRRTGAEFVGLIVRQGDSPMIQAAEYFAGFDLRKRAHELGLATDAIPGRSRFDHLRSGRVYSTAEFTDHDPVYRMEAAKNLQQLGIKDERVVRIPDIEGVQAWLMLARARDCTAADSALLSSLAPYVEVALRNLVLIDRQRVQASTSLDGLARLGTGWIVFDKDAHVLSCAPNTEEDLRRILGHAPRRGERLHGVTHEADRQLTEAAATFAADRNLPPVPVVLSEDPWLGALLVPSEPPPPGALAVTAMLALVRLPREASQGREERLARMFDLPRREAELAIALSDGKSLAEAGNEMGLTIETTRNYSKRLYAKLSVRGQAELVRLVHQISPLLG